MKYSFLLRLSLFYGFFLVYSQLFAQIIPKSEKLIDGNNLSQALKDIHINLYIRSSLELPLSKDLNRDNLLSSFKLNEGRFEVRGTVWKNLNFRMRTRFSTTRPQFQLSNSNNNIDYALIGYKFGDGERKPFEIAVGKQNNMLGSWEFWKNPTYEYRYSSIGGGRAINIFPVGARFSYSPTENHSFTIQAFNTYSNGFRANFTSTDNTNIAPDFKPARIPATILLAWKGNFWQNHLQTWYSIAMKNYAQNNPNYQIGIGHSLSFPKLQLYFDIVSTYTDFEYTKLLQKTYTAYYNQYNPTNKLPQVARNFLYSSAILRLDYEFIPRFFLTAKAWYERGDALKNDKIGTGFHNNLAFLAGLEYKPFKAQDMRIFAYYYNDRTFHNERISPKILPNNLNQTIAFGILYFVKVL